MRASRRWSANYFATCRFEFATAALWPPPRAPGQRGLRTLVLDRCCPTGERGLRPVAARSRRFTQPGICAADAHGAGRVRWTASSSSSSRRRLPAKPFEPRELLARVKALLRRSQLQPAGDDVLLFGRLGRPSARGWPCSKRQGLRSDRPTSFRSAGRAWRIAPSACSRATDHDSLKGHPLKAFDRSIDVHISPSARVIEDAPNSRARAHGARAATCSRAA